MREGLKTFTISRRLEIDMGHRIPDHKSKCRNLHGHHYVFEIEVQGALRHDPGASDHGMVMDFGDVKELLTAKILEPWDHGFMMYERDPLSRVFSELPDQKIIFVPFIPTAENIASHAFDILAPILAERRLQLVSLTVWETPNSRATVGCA